MRTLVAEDRQASCSGLLSFIFIMEKAMHVGGVGLLPRSCAIIFSVSLHLKPMNLILVVGWETWCKFKQARIGHTTRGRNTKVTHPILSYIYKIHGKKKGHLFIASFGNNKPLSFSKFSSCSFGLYNENICPKFTAELLAIWSSLFKRLGPSDCNRIRSNIWGGPRDKFASFSPHLLLQYVCFWLLFLRGNSGSGNQSL